VLERERKGARGEDREEENVKGVRQSLQGGGEGDKGKGEKRGLRGSQAEVGWTVRVVLRLRSLLFHHHHHPVHHNYNTIKHKYSKSDSTFLQNHS
jgi:hypothetical protein